MYSVVNKHSTGRPFLTFLGINGSGRAEIVWGQNWGLILANFETNAFHRVDL